MRLLFSAIPVLVWCLAGPPAPAAQPAATDAGTAAPAAAPAPKKNTQTSPARGKAAPHASVRHMGEELGAGSSWYLDGTPRKARGAVWERGIPMENLSRKRTPPTRAGGAAAAGGPPDKKQGANPKPSPTQGVAAGKGGVDTTRGIDSALGDISSYERQPADGSALGLKKPGVPSLQVTREESAWRNPVTQPHTTGQDVMTTRRNVVGAYADVVKSDDLHVTLGPELHIPEADPTAAHVAPQQKDSSSVGFGMKWQWDF